MHANGEVRNRGHAGPAERPALARNVSGTCAVRPVLPGTRLATNPAGDRSDALHRSRNIGCYDVAPNVPPFSQRRTQHMTSIGVPEGLGAALAGLVRRGALPRRAVPMALAATLVVATTGPALAADATGTWSGRSTCWQKGRAPVRKKVRNRSTMLISQSGAALSVDIDGTAYCGESHDSNRSGTRARGRAARCTDGGTAFADLSEVLTLKIK